MSKRPVQGQDRLLPHGVQSIHRRTAMKKQGTTDAKRRAANDVEKKAKPDERFVIGQTDTVKRGFLKEFCDFTRKKGTASAEMLIAEFAGRQIDGHKIDAARVHRYIRYSVNHGHFKLAK